MGSRFSAAAGEEEQRTSRDVGRFGAALSARFAREQREPLALCFLLERCRFSYINGA